jgi:hypothetical protein
MSCSCVGRGHDGGHASRTLVRERASWRGQRRVAASCPVRVSVEDIVDESVILNLTAPLPCPCELCPCAVNLRPCSHVAAVWAIVQDREIFGAGVHQLSLEGALRDRAK